MKKSKKVLKLLTSFALVAAIAVGFTLAYLSSVTDTKENKFTSDSNITGELTEEDTWKDGWKDYKPGESKAKTPTISLEKGSEAARVGMKVAFYNTTGSTEANPVKDEISANDFFTKFGTLSFNNGGLNLGAAGTDTWSAVDVNGNALFYVYNNILTDAKATEPLFDKVTINTGIYTYYDITSTEKTVWTTDVNGNKVEVKDNYVLVEEDTKFYLKEADGSFTEVTGNTKLPSFQIDVTGYATQAYADGQPIADWQDQLLKLAELTAE